MSPRRILSLFFGFEGRIGRRTFWIGIVAVCATLALAYFPYAALWTTYGRSMVVSVFVHFVFFVLVFLPVLALSVKRLHDRGKSGWWILPFYFVPHWLLKISEKVPAGDVVWWLSLSSSVALSLWGLIELGFLPSRERHRTSL